MSIVTRAQRAYVAKTDVENLVIYKQVRQKAGGGNVVQFDAVFWKPVKNRRAA